MEPKEYLAKLPEKEEVRPWLAEILATGSTPPWIGVRVSIFRKTLSFEAKGWKIFVCMILDPSLNKNNLPLERVVPGVSVMAGYPINVGGLPISLWYHNRVTAPTPTPAPSQST